MTKKRPMSDLERLEAAAREAKQQKYVLRLYVAGVTPRSQEAIRNVTAICEEHLAGRCELEVIDLYQQPTLAQGEQIIAAPDAHQETARPPAEGHRQPGGQREDSGGIGPEA